MTRLHMMEVRVLASLEHQDRITLEQALDRAKIEPGLTAEYFARTLYDLEAAGQVEHDRGHPIYGRYSLTSAGWITLQEGRIQWAQADAQNALDRREFWDCEGAA